MKFIVLSFLACLFAVTVRADNGYRLWLAGKAHNICRVTFVKPVEPACKMVAKTLADEIHAYCNSEKLVVNIKEGSPAGSFFIHGDTLEAADMTAALYGAYALLRRQAVLPGGVVPQLKSRPLVAMRMLNHWDNLDGSIERGYAGRSIFWSTGKDKNAWLGRIKDYARANASVGINCVSLNNVNASPDILKTEYIDSVRMIADVLRPYGIKVFLSINFASPMALKATPTADPLDKKVIGWWTGKVKDIYRVIPDFGGFLVKASSEGQPGPNDFGRSHADGANMLAAALKPFGGVVIWRSFVYGANHKGEDRVMQAVSEFKPLDGKFAGNVILQSKNGPLDFQPREPYAPIFDQIKSTRQAAELQITQEYTGQARHLVYLEPMWKEFFSYVNVNNLDCVAGVANTGNDENWCGHDFSQANWYCFGRMLWQDSSAVRIPIAEEWLLQTFNTRDAYFLTEMERVMNSSREACVDYMMPLGLHHIFKFDHHYGPEPDGYKKNYPLEWCPVYYHKADKQGIGFDRTVKSGSGATAQYREPFCRLYEDEGLCPEKYLLWFHHVSWNSKLSNGKTLWQNIVLHYDRGVAAVADYKYVWSTMRQYVDSERWQRTAALLEEQYQNACEWKQTCINYFNSIRTGR